MREGYRTATRDLAGRICRHCLAGIRKGDHYRVAGYTRQKKVIYEHLWCVGQHREEGQPARPTAAKQPPRPPLVERIAKRQTMTMREPDGRETKGTGTNFPGLVIEWQWDDEQLPCYRLHVGAIAAARLSIERQCDERVHGAVEMLLSRVGKGPIESEKLWEEAKEADGEFDLGLGYLASYMALIGYSLLKAECVSEGQVVRMNAMSENFIANILEGEADES